MDHLIAVKQGQLAIHFKHALDHKHHIRTTRVIFIKNKCHRVLERPWQNPFAEFGHLLAIAQHNRIFTDQIDTADMAVEINPDTGPVQPRRDLFDMG